MTPDLQALPFVALVNSKPLIHKQRKQKAQNIESTRKHAHTKKTESTTTLKAQEHTRTQRKQKAEKTRTTTNQQTQYI